MSCFESHKLCIKCTVQYIMNIEYAIFSKFSQKCLPWISRIHHKHVPRSGMRRDVAGLAEALFLGAARPEAEHGRVVLRHVEEERAVLDGTVKDQDLEETEKSQQSQK